MQRRDGPYIFDVVFGVVRVRLFGVVLWRFRYDADAGTTREVSAFWWMDESRGCGAEVGMEDAF